MEKQMKRIIALLLVLVMSFTLFACTPPVPDNGNTNLDGVRRYGKQRRT